MSEEAIAKFVEKNFPDKYAAIVMSACLHGINCKYNGKNNKSPLVMNFFKYRRIVSVCPEIHGGLPTPRPPQCIKKGNGHDVLYGETPVINQEGKDVTEEFKKGAYETLRKARFNRAKYAVMKESSPSCGVKHVYNLVNKKEKLVDGPGVTTALLITNDIKVFSEKEIEALIKEL